MTARQREIVARDLRRIAHDIDFTLQGRFMQIAAAENRIEPDNLRQASALLKAEAEKVEIHD